MTELDDYLRPAPIAGEAVRFDLSAYRSTVTRQMLQLRLRMTPTAFGTGTSPLAANVVDDGAALEVDAAGLEAANDEVRSRLDAGPEWALVYLRQLSTSQALLERVARSFATPLSRGTRPRAAALVTYVFASAGDQALGALKFCLPEGLRPRLEAALGGPDVVDALLAPDGPTLWSELRSRELSLARLRQRGPAAPYRRRLARHRRQYGYLLAEDVDFRASESLDALDARMAALTAGDLGAERRRLTSALAGDRARKILARRLFAEQPQSAGLVSNVLLARALAAHEDLNRRAKMRLLRDLRDLADLAGLDIERAGLADLAAACATRSPVLRSVAVG